MNTPLLESTSLFEIFLFPTDTLAGPDAGDASHLTEWAHSNCYIPAGDPVVKNTAN